MSLSGFLPLVARLLVLGSFPLLLCLSASEAHADPGTCIAYAQDWRGAKSSGASAQAQAVRLLTEAANCPSLSKEITAWKAQQAKVAPPPKKKTLPKAVLPVAKYKAPTGPVVAEVEGTFTGKATAIFLSTSGTVTYDSAAVTIAKYMRDTFFRRNPTILSDDLGFAMQLSDVVDAKEHQTSTQGVLQLATDWHGAIWFFSSWANRDKFIANPETYAPQFGGYCVWCLVEDYKYLDDDHEEGPPARGTLPAVANGKLYFVFDKSKKEEFLASPDEYIIVAHRNWARLHVSNFVVQKNDSEYAVKVRAALAGWSVAWNPNASKSAEVNLKAADAALAHKSYVEAAALYEKACADSSGVACRKGGRLYDPAIGPVVPALPKNDKKSADLYSSACVIGDAWGCNNVGTYYFYARGGYPKDQQKALTLYKKACTDGNARGCTNVALVYIAGELVPKDVAQALILLKDACTAKVTVGCGPLGALYELGRDVPKDTSRAAFLYDRSCNAEDTDGCALLGTLYETGNAVTKDVGRAMKLYVQACEGNQPRGCADLGRAYLAGISLPQDNAKAMEYYERACKGGEPIGCSGIGYLYYYGKGVPRDLAKATTIFERACDDGESNACVDAAVAYRTGSGVYPDIAKAAELDVKACEGNNWMGCAMAVNLYRTGTGVPRDLTKAREYAVLTKQLLPSGDLPDQWKTFVPEELKQLGIS